MAYGTFNHGGATYPLTANLSNSLLKDADPAIFYALEYFEAILRQHIGDRLLAQAAQHGIQAIRRVVEQKIPYDPRPWLQEVQLPFPLLAVYRIASKYGVASSSFMRNEATWQVSYSLPPLTAAQIEQVGPILHAVESALLNRIENMGDPEYRDGAEVWELAGIEEITLESGTFGTFVAGSNIFYPTWLGTLKVRERDMPPPDAAYDGDFKGLDAVISSQSGNEPAVTIVDMKVDDYSVSVTEIASLVGMYVASEGITLDSTEALVASWANQVEGGNPMTPLAPANQPVYGQDADTGIPIVCGDGAALQLSATMTEMAVDTGKTLVFAFRLYDVAKRSTIGLVTSTLANGTLALEANTVSTAGGLLGLFVTGSSFDTQFQADTDWHIAVIRVSASSGSIVSTTRMQVDDQSAVLTLKSGTGTWATLALANKFGVLGLTSDMASTAAGGAVGIALAFDSELSNADTATAVAFCKQWLRSQQQ